MRGYSGRHMAWCTCWIGSSTGTWARPSSAAATATATPTAAETGRRSFTGGSSGAPGVVASDSAATASAAAAIMPSVIRLARATVTPSPRPGKTSALLACAIVVGARRRASTGGNGLPVAISARPSVQRIRSAGSASHFEVGLDSGMMIGRSMCAAMSARSASVNAPVWVEVPISMVGLGLRDDVGQPDAAGRRRAQPATSAAGRA